MKRTLEQMDRDHGADDMRNWWNMHNRARDVATEIADGFTGKVDGDIMPFLYEAAATAFILGFRDGVLSEEIEGVFAEIDDKLDDPEWLFGAAE